MTDVQYDTPLLNEDTPLVLGTEMWCPNCKKLFDILRFIPLQRRRACSNQTVNIYKCPSCKFLFAPLLDLRDFD